METRETLKSRLGFLMVAAGCAVGLGNVWRFPYIVGQNGGAAFVLIYIFFLFLLGFPLLIAELTLGRASQKGIASSFSVLQRNGTIAKTWNILGKTIFAGAFLLLMYYTNVGGWLLRYTFGYCKDGLAFVNENSALTFDLMQSDGLTCVIAAFSGILVSCTVCAFGVTKGVETVTKWMMITLLVLLGVLAVKSLTLSGAGKGIEYYLKPNWQPFLENPFKICFEAMGQAFFTLSVGVGSMTIFGSYLKKDRSLVSESIWIIIIDTIVALVSGLIIFPICFTYNIDPGCGPELIFIALPKVFNQLPSGGIWASLFFLFLSLAALSTIIAVFECLIGGIIDETKLKRSRATILTGIGIAVLSLPCIFSTNILSSMTIAGKSILEFEDFIFSQFWLPLGALTMCVFCVTPLGMNWDRFSKEASTGEGIKLPRFFKYYMRYILPAILFTILLAGLI